MCRVGRCTTCGKALSSEERNYSTPFELCGSCEVENSINYRVSSYIMNLLDAFIGVVDRKIQAKLRGVLS